MREPPPPHPRHRPTVSTQRQQSERLDVLPSIRSTARHATFTNRRSFRSVDRDLETEIEREGIRRESEFPSPRFRFVGDASRFHCSSPSYSSFRSLFFDRVQNPTCARLVKQLIRGTHFLRVTFSPTTFRYFPGNMAH